MRVVGLDHGARRIGVAVGDTEIGMAFARPAIQRRNLDRDVGLIAELCTAEGAGTVVIGLPLNMDGSEGPQAEAARAFGDLLVDIGLEVAFEDERLTTWEAKRQSTGHASRESGEIDSAAARLILQQYLDARPRPPLRPEETE